MFGRFIDAFTKPRNPSVILAVGEDRGSIEFLHLHPETGEVERFRTSCRLSTFQSHGSRETTRKQIGTVTLPAKGLASADGFFEDVTAQVRERWDDFMASNPSNIDSVARLVQDVLKPAALEVIKGRGGRDAAGKETETHSVFLIYITRPQPERVTSLEPTSPG
ncbi:hypothetical protein MGYG_03393 [Nannizzia gypsea CBS 118893]|uniref:Uncharacterized protein n=1 Tax=Arthroderma gypseum (strain ATCC MYA-4604 / CBS 118893) TaxID=535722 RepID=E4UND9_ARTGP|nr:hypothetical protein MGYG_03393 [Nannizzia gypsea CBS 118893]EFR00389.1 hypothetical protein MGYG_03393 [Nannizzia gypsea CBS 118893]